MTAVAVRRLRLVAPVEARIGAVQRIEEGLRLGAPAGQRVLLIRHLPLGALPLRGPARAWTARIEDTLRAIAAEAVYGLAPGANRATAVWFHSIEEMLAALLGLIGRGEQPSAWYWRAGAPAWDGTCSPASASALLTTLGRTPAGMVATARTVIALTEGGHLSVIIAALEPIVRRRLPPPRATGGEKHAERTADVDRAVRLLARLSPAARAGLAAALRGGAAEPSRAQWLAEAALVAAAPEFTTTPGLLARTAAAWRAEQAAVAAPDQAPAAATRNLPTDTSALAPPPTRRPSWRPPPARSPSAPDLTGPVPPIALRKPRADGAPAGPDTDRSAAPDLAAIAKAATRERGSAAAGVLLLVGPLVRLGLPAWLAARATLAAEGFGRALMCEMAARHRAPPDDPVRMLAREEPPALWSDALTAWRICLDRWLRRRARIRLCDVAGKRGWLTIAEDGIDVRFAPDAADVRLRRLALDLDPGWVPWLGLTVRYHYRTEPLA
jgi:hypothetical protein